MKKLFKNIVKFSSRLLALVILLDSLVKAGEGYGQSALILVGKVEGNVFYTYQGKTQNLQAQQQLMAGTDLYVDEGGQVSFLDFNNHQFHLAGGGQITIAKGNILLLRGVLWIQSLQDQQTLQVVTANGQVQLQGGEGILSFDPAAGKTQLLVLRGNFILANLQNLDYSVSVGEGEFSFVTERQANGAPRTPTGVGPQSFAKLLQLFSHVTPLAGTRSQMVVSENPHRSPASKEQVTHLETQGVKLEQIYQEQLAKLASSQYSRTASTKTPKSSVQITIFNLAPAKSTNFSSLPSAEQEKTVLTPNSVSNQNNRAPASGGNDVGGSRESGGAKPSEVFEASILGQYKKQMRHSTEVNQLIDQLQSFQQDYQKNY